MSVSNYSTNRKAMIDSQLRTSGVSASWVLAAMGSEPREEFVPAAAKDIAYMDRQIPLADGRTMNPPMATGLMLQQADVNVDDEVLVIGGAAGYSAKLLARRAKRVVIVEQDKALASAAKTSLSGLTNVAVVEGALNEGAAKQGPYSLIVIDGAIEQLPSALLDQLVDGGRIVTGLSEGAVTRIAMGVKRANVAALRPFSDCSVAKLPGFESAAEFVF
jgi:protein-L-isoaspartate(D-aspartate) O-methyltransferase